MCFRNRFKANLIIKWYVVKIWFCNIMKNGTSHQEINCIVLRSNSLLDCYGGLFKENINDHANYSSYRLCKWHYNVSTK